MAERTQPRRITQDTEGRAQAVGARESHRRVELQASMRDTADGARLTLDPLAEPVSPMATTEECRTTGLLEHQIMDAVAATS